MEPSTTVKPLLTTSMFVMLNEERGRGGGGGGGGGDREWDKGRRAGEEVKLLEDYIVRPSKKSCLKNDNVLCFKAIAYLYYTCINFCFNIIVHQASGNAAIVFLSQQYCCHNSVAV